MLDQHQVKMSILFLLHLASHFVMCLREIEKRERVCVRACVYVLVCACVFNYLW